MISVISYSQETPVSEHGQLQIDGRYLKDSQDEIIQLRGMSLFWSQWEPEFYTASTVSILRNDWQSNVVRVAMGIEHGGYLENKEAELKKVKTVIDAAIAEGIYVIVDWHDHHAEDHQVEAIEFFGTIAQEYGTQPNIIYELYNEPLDVSWAEVLKPYHLAVIGAIREYDPNNVILVGTPRWSQRVDLAAADPINLPNIGYVLHFYAGTHGKELIDIAQEAIDKGLPLFVSEYGSTTANGDGKIFPEETKVWWDFMDANGISYCNWSVANKDEGSAAIKPSQTDISLDENLTDSGILIKKMLIDKSKN